jgi:hypothetical protein
MKLPVKLFAFFGATLLVGLMAGVFIGSRIAAKQNMEALHGILLSNATLDTTRCTMLLKAIREGEVDCATERLETHLDLAIIGVGREYSAERDQYTQAENSLARAREYRAAYPRTSSLASVDHQVASALTIRSPAH